MRTDMLTYSAPVAQALGRLARNEPYDDGSLSWRREQSGKSGSDIGAEYHARIRL